MRRLITTCLFLLYSLINCNVKKVDYIELRVSEIKVIEPKPYSEHSTPLLSLTLTLINHSQKAYIDMKELNIYNSVSIISFEIENSHWNRKKIFFSPFNNLHYDIDSIDVVSFSDSLKFYLLMDSKDVLSESINWYRKKNNSSLNLPPTFYQEYLEYLKSKRFEVKLKIKNCNINLLNYQPTVVNDINGCFGK